jgi:hypothetical protein
MDLEDRWAWVAAFKQRQSAVAEAPPEGLAVLPQVVESPTSTRAEPELSGEGEWATRIVLDDAGGAVAALRIYRR